ncbi:MAG: peptide chain release factor H [Bacteroidia bacterium]|nr:peptide chain release factor H [Bacteroidia bacterium]
MGNFSPQGQVPARYLLITSGRGPVECCWVVAQLAAKVKEAFQAEGLKLTTIRSDKGPEPGTLASVLLQVEGHPSREFIAQWSGTVQWIGKSRFRKFHKRKNWFVGLAWMETERQLSWKDSDLEFQTFKASGPGGQHRNKVESAVRLIHRPSGLTITCSESRSQLQNRKLARERFAKALADFVVEQEQNRIMEEWSQHFLLERGNPVHVFKG